MPPCGSGEVQLPKSFLCVVCKVSTAIACASACAGVCDVWIACCRRAPTTARNALRVLRALQLPCAVLLEGSPGVGKTALVAALARAAGLF